jgi:hypothetical protein
VPAATSIPVTPPLDQLPPADLATELVSEEPPQHALPDEPVPSTTHLPEHAAPEQEQRQQ